MLQTEPMSDPPPQASNTPSHPARGAHRLLLCLLASKGHELWSQGRRRGVRASFLAHPVQAKVSHTTAAPPHTQASKAGPHAHGSCPQPRSRSPLTPETLRSDRWARRPHQAEGPGPYQPDPPLCLQLPHAPLAFMSSKNSAGEDSTRTWELETPNSGTRFRIHWNRCTPSGHRQQGGELTCGTAGDSKGASKSHGDLGESRAEG